MPSEKYRGFAAVSPGSAVVPVARPAGSLSFADDDHELRLPSLPRLRQSPHLLQSLRLRLLRQLHRLHLSHLHPASGPLVAELEVAQPDQFRSAVGRMCSRRFRHQLVALESDFSADKRIARFLQKEIWQPRVMPGWKQPRVLPGWTPPGPRQRFRSGSPGTNRRRSFVAISTLPPGSLALFGIWVSP